MPHGAGPGCGHGAVECCGAKGRGARVERGVVAHISAACFPVVGRGRAKSAPASPISCLALSGESIFPRSRDLNWYPFYRGGSSRFPTFLLGVWSPINVIWTRHLNQTLDGKRSRVAWVFWYIPTSRFKPIVVANTGRVLQGNVGYNFFRSLIWLILTITRSSSLTFRPSGLPNGRRLIHTLVSF